MLADRIFLTFIMLAAYGVGFVLVRFTVGLVLPMRPAPEGLEFLLAGVPLLLCLLFEWASGLWDGTSGTLGLGALTVAVPMLLAGVSTAVACLLMRCLGPVLAHGFSREELGMAITAWGVATIGLAVVSVALWRYWPEPMSRSF